VSARREASIDGSWARAASSDLRVHIVDALPPPHDAAAAASLWRSMCDANPRLFDGPILSVSVIESKGESIHALRVRCGSYAALAVQNPQIAGHVETGTDQLSVTAVVLAKGQSGRERVLLGRRGANTRIYPSMWELGPSGGVDPPSLDTHEVTRDMIEKQVDAETHEEIGESLRVRVESIPAITYDPIARSYDIVALCRAESIFSPDFAQANWEYEGSLWISLSEIATFDREHARSIIAPTRSLFRFFGWV
jgi:hypothetical protein